MSFDETRSIPILPKMEDLQEALVNASLYDEDEDFITQIGDVYVFTKSTIWTPTQVISLDSVIATVDETPVGRAPSLGFASGRWLDNSGGTVAELQTPEALDGGILYTVVFRCHDLVTFDRIAVNLTSPASSGSGRLGIYTSSGNGTPDVLVVECSTTFDTSTAGVKELPTKVRLYPGYYFLALTHDSPTPVEVMAFSAVGAPLFLGWPASIISTCEMVIQATFPFGPLPAVFPSPLSYSTLCPPRLTLRVAT